MRKRHLILLLVLFVAQQLVAQSISLELRDAPLDEAFKKIQEQSSYRFVYTKEELSGAKPVTVSLRNAALEQVLQQCFKNQPLTYSITDEYVIVKQKEGSRSLPLQLPLSINGVVLSETGEPIPKATVMLRGSTLAVATNDQGRFSLDDVPLTSTIVVSCVGYLSQTVDVKGRASINVILTVEVNSLEETLVIAYGTTSKRLNTGSVSKIDGKDIARQPVGNPLAALYAKAPGLYIQQQSGIPGSGFTIQLRGQNSILSGNSPLFIVDGVVFNGSPLQQVTQSTLTLSPFNTLNPADIESVEILKDADATSIYGSRGSNGVILITTRKGKQGKMQTTASFSFGGGKVTRTRELLDTKAYLRMRRQAFIQDGYTPTQAADPDILVWDTTRYTDWDRYMIGGTAKLYNAQVSASGGNEVTSFRIGTHYRKETTVFPGDFSDVRGGLNFSVRHEGKSKKTGFTFSGLYNVNRNNLFNIDFTKSLINYAPNAPNVYDSTGKLNWEQNTWTNPLARTKTKYRAVTDNLLGQVSAFQQLHPHVQLQLNAGFTKQWMEENIQFVTASLNPFNNLKPSAQFGNRAYTTWNLEPQLHYTRQSGRVKISGLIGATVQQSRIQGQGVNASNFSSDAQLSNIAAAANLSVLNTTDIDYKYAAVFGRLTANLYDRYILNLTGRRDGSSRFARGKQYANFGSIGGAWIWSEEKWLSGAKRIIPFGKFRLSYGSSGNDQIADYGFLNTYTSTLYPYQGASAITPSRLFNDSYSWEVNRKFEAGAELSFLRNRLQVKADYYRNLSGNQLVGLSLPATAGFNSVQANLPAKVENKGWELEVSSINIRQADWHWTSSFNISFNRNKLVAYPGLAGSLYANTYVVGQPLSVAKLYQYLYTSPEDGLFYFANAAGQPVLSPSFSTDTRAFDLSRSYFGGLSNSIRFRSWELDFTWQFVKQPLIYAPNDISPPGHMGNQPAELRPWLDKGDNTAYQRLTSTYGAAYTGYSKAGLSSYFIVDGSFLRLKNVSLQYRLSATFCKSLHIEGGQLFFQAQNLVTITPYNGLDPENNSTGLPPLRMITGGLQFNF